MLEGIDSQHGLAALAGSICVLLALQLVLKVGQFVWEIVRKKSEVSEQSIEKLTVAISVMTKTLDKLDNRISQIERNHAEFPKFKDDMRKLFSALKILSGDRWTQIRNAIVEDKFE